MQHIRKSTMKKRTPFFSRLYRNLGLQLLVLPGVIYFLIFAYKPMAGIVIAFQKFSIRKGIWNSPWVGFYQFQRLFDNPYFFKLIRNTLILSVYSLLWGFWPPILLALMLNEPMNGRWRKFVQTVSYLPHFISTVAVCGMLILMLSPSGGTINNLVRLLTGENIYFLVKPEYYRTIYIGSGIWQGIGFSSIIYIAALSSVDPELYEAATIDGASRVQKIVHVSLPSILPTIIILLIFNVGGLLNSSTEKTILLYQDSTMSVADTLGSYNYRVGLISTDYSSAAAVGLFNNVVSFLLVVLANATARRLTETSLW